MLGADARDTFEPMGSNFNEKSELTVRFQRYYNGVRVLGGGVKVTVDGKGKAVFNHDKRSDAAVATVVPDITEVAVKEVIARDLGLLAAQATSEATIPSSPAAKCTYKERYMEGCS